MFHEYLLTNTSTRRQHLPNTSENRLRVGEKAHNAADLLLEFFVLENIFEKVKEEEGKKVCARCAEKEAFDDIVGPFFRKLLNSKQWL